MGLERRTLLKLSGLAGAAAAAVAVTGSGGLAETMPAALDEQEMALLKQLLARLLPADATGGGAVEAGAHVYIDRALGGYHRQHLPLYRDALAAIASAMAAAQGRAEDRLDALLTQMASGHAGASFTGGGKPFFALLHSHMLEGTFGDPAYGGNRNYLGWQMIGYPGVQLVVSAAEQAVDGPHAEINRSLATFGGTAVS